MGNLLGVCSWSLTRESPQELARLTQECAVRHLQLALDPIRAGDWTLGDTRKALDESGIAIASGMMATAGEDYSTIDSIRRTGGVRPSELWAENLDAARANAAIAHELGVGLVTLHAGFIPEDAGDPERGVLIDRLAVLSRVFLSAGVRVALETGQETAGTLHEVLGDPRLADVGVNFDPANMLLYGSGDPVEALSLLAPRVMQVHLKDADPSPEPGMWGTERPLGAGSVDWDGVFGVIASRLPDVDLIVEREAGPSRVEDVRTAVALASRYGATP